jgi:vacuolar-type H+-ATPase subunit I/STV1
MSEETKAKIDSLNVHIKIIEEDNKKLDTAITLYNKEVEKVDNIINNIKNEKTIIKEFYHEKIISIDNYSSAQIDSFFTNRYRLHP